MDPIIRLGTRGSPLALTQARMVAEGLRAAHGWPEEAVAITVFKTSGDRIQDRPLAEVGGKALWTKELDTALVEGRIDIAVHSMKDVETFTAAGTAIAAMLPRADVRDRLVGAESVADLAPGARVGTSSPRRAAQLLRRRADCRVVMLRGNVETRLARIAEGAADATFLAAAGLDRLGRPDVGHPVEVDEMLPAPAQGAVGIGCRADDARVHGLLAAIDHPATSAAVRLERGFLAALGGTCRTPVAALAEPQVTGAWRMRAEILSIDGGECVEGAFDAPDARAAADRAAALADELLARATKALRSQFGS